VGLNVRVPVRGVVVAVRLELAVLVLCHGGRLVDICPGVDEHVVHVLQLHIELLPGKVVSAVRAPAGAQGEWVSCVDRQRLDPLYPCGAHVRGGSGACLRDLEA
jgi:hypothetical protein